MWIFIATKVLKDRNVRTNVWHVWHIKTGIMQYIPALAPSKQEIGESADSAFQGSCLTCKCNSNFWQNNLNETNTF